MAQLAAKCGYQTAAISLNAEEYDARFKKSVDTMRKIIAKTDDPFIQAINHKFYQGTSDTLFSSVSQRNDTRQQRLEHSSAHAPKVRRV